VICSAQNLRGLGVVHGWRRDAGPRLPRELVDTAAGSLGSWRGLIVPVLVLSKRSGKCYDRCLMPWVADVHKVAHQLQQHALAAG
jgi:hypothetical protein